MNCARHVGKNLLRMSLCLLLLVGAQVLGIFSVIALSTAEAQSGKPEGLYYKSWAIIIGIENYVLAPSIPGAISDAKKVAEAFRRLGFDEVVEFYDKDAGSRRLHQLLNDMLPRKVGRMDRLVIFYMGHAGTMQDSDGQERGYLVPFDAQINNAAKSITVEHLKEFTRRSASKHTLLILDAPVFGWETTVPAELSLEGRMAPESDTDRRAVQVISAAGKERPLFASRRAVALLKPYWSDFQVPPIWTETVGSWLPSWGATLCDRSRRLPMVHNVHRVYGSTVMETRR